MTFAELPAAKEKLGERIIDAGRHILALGSGLDRQRLPAARVTPDIKDFFRTFDAALLCPPLDEFFKQPESKREVPAEKKPAEASPGEKLFDRSQIKKIKRLTESGDEEVTLKEGERLKSGDYEVEFANGRCFRIHIPPGDQKNLPVMFLIPGCSNKDQDPRGYIAESHMHAQADKGPQKFIVVTPLTEKHKIGMDSTVEASAWNLPGALVHKKDVEAHAKKVGYDDRDYFAGVIRLVPQLTEAMTDHRGWGFTAGSQGAAALHRLASDERFKDQIRNIYVVGGTMEAGDQEMGGKDAGFDGSYEVDPYDIKGENGKRVVIVDTAGDKLILPHRPHVTSAALFALAKRFKLQAIGLDAIDPRHQDPEKQESTYLRLDNDTRVKVFRKLGDSDAYRVKAFIAKDNGKKLKNDGDFDQELKDEDAVKKAREANKDIRWVYLDKKRGTEVEVYELPTAAHVIPGPREGSTSTEKSKKYEGFFTAETFARDLIGINELLKKGAIKKDLR